ncbi:MAG: peptide chain release factor N(5)-glutamine methyltransferase [Firmicutes bacterium]|mgnify:CR=1 FL=1|nr:peptide chain release factor N(5)-glutamine methyltransferase [Bacillota bacterium]
MATRLEALRLGKEILKTDGARRDAEILLRHLLQESRAEFYRKMDKGVPALVLFHYRHLLTRRAAGCPIQYLTGSREFMGLDFHVNENVLIPRPETEILVELALKLLQEEIKPAKYGDKLLPPTIVDLGTGSGAIAVSLAKGLTKGKIYALDVSPAALLVAKKNARLHGVLDRIIFMNGDFLSPLNKELRCPQVDLLLSNPPYIPTGELAHLPREVGYFEPRIALDGGRDGLDFYRRLALEVPNYLRREGWLVVEIGQGQEGRVQEILATAEIFTSLQVLPDLAGIPRVVAAKRAGKA